MMKIVRKTVTFSVKVKPESMKKFRQTAADEGVLSDRLFGEMLEAWEEKQAEIKAAKEGR